LGAGTTSKASRYFKIRIANILKLHRITDIINNLMQRFVAPEI